MTDDKIVKNTISYLKRVNKEIPCWWSFNEKYIKNSLIMVAQEKDKEWLERISKIKAEAENDIQFSKGCNCEDCIRKVIIIATCKKIKGDDKK